MNLKRRTFVAAAAASATSFVPGVLAQNKYGQGVSDEEILVGSTQPLSGAASVYSTAGKVSGAYFKVINAQGGINGRKIRFVPLDDGFSPPRTVEQTRRLVEVDRVAMMYGQVGTATSLAVRKYLNDSKTPQLFVGSSASTWNDEIDKYPYSRGWAPLYPDEGRAIAKHIMATRPQAKIGVLYQNDDGGKDLLRGLKDGLGTAVAVREQSCELTDPTADSQVIALQSSGADLFVIFATPKLAAQAIRKAYDSEWRPQMYVMAVSSSVPQVLTPAGLEKSKGIISAAFVKDPGDPSWANDKGMQEFVAFMNATNPNVAKDQLATEGYCRGQTLVQLLKQCGNDLTSDNMMQQSMRLDLELPLLLPGLKIKTTLKDRHPLRSFRMQQFDGSSYKLLPALT